MKEIEAGSERERLQTIVGTSRASAERAKWGKGQKLDKRQDGDRLKVDQERPADHRIKRGLARCKYLCSGATETGIEGKFREKKDPGQKCGLLYALCRKWIIPYLWSLKLHTKKTYS